MSLLHQTVVSAALESKAEPNSPSADSKKHERFYLEDGNVKLLLHAVLYHVHRYFFRDSTLMSGATTSPIKLTCVQSVEFDAFLAILYPSNYATCELATFEEWTSVLRLASQWGFQNIRDLAIARLKPITSAIDKVVLSHTYPFLETWAVLGYAELCARAAPLSLAEAGRLGLEGVLLVCNMRENTR
ncbi:hypothetical protein BV25DRAFT_1811630, partial [Artomyces pyxidatus]